MSEKRSAGRRHGRCSTKIKIVDFCTRPRIRISLSRFVILDPAWSKIQRLRRATCCGERGVMSTALILRRLRCNHNPRRCCLINFTNEFLPCSSLTASDIFRTCLLRSRSRCWKKRTATSVPRTTKYVRRSHIPRLLLDFLIFGI